MTPAARFLVLFLCSACALTNAIGCGWLARSLQAREYSFGFYNGTRSTLNDVRIEWGPRPIRDAEEVGILSPNAGAHISDEPRPIPRVFVVTWKTSDGVAHRQVVERAVMPDEAKFHGTIWFDFADKGVSLMANTYDEQTRLAFDHKPFDH